MERFGQLSWLTIIATSLAMEAVFLAFKYARFTILSGVLAGAAAVIVSGIATFISMNLAPYKDAMQLRSEAIQFLVPVMTVAPLSYLLAMALRSAFYKFS